MKEKDVPRRLELVRGGVVLGTIDVKPERADPPWYSGAFHPSVGFNAVRGLFERELALIRANTHDDAAQWDQWEVVNGELHEPGLQLRALDGSYAAEEILIHIDGDEAWWRDD